MTATASRRRMAEHIDKVDRKLYSASFYFVNIRVQASQNHLSRGYFQENIHLQKQFLIHWRKNLRKRCKIIIIPAYHKK